MVARAAVAVAFEVFAFEAFVVARLGAVADLPMDLLFAFVSFAPRFVLADVVLRTVAAVFFDFAVSLEEVDLAFD